MKNLKRCIYALWIIFIFPGALIHEGLHILAIILFDKKFDFYWNLSFKECRFKPHFEVNSFYLQ